MNSDVQVAVIGGGIVGASVLYWLAKMGWTDSILLERRELTSGSTWHAAGNTTYFGPYPAMTRLFAGSIRTYLQAEQESGHSVSFHQTGSLRLAATERELRLFHEYKPRYQELGIPFHVRTPEEVAGLHPLIDISNIFGAAQGINVPLYATQHQEMITESIPTLESLEHEVPAWRDSYVSCSVRQEGKGVLAGVYEAEPKFWALDGIPKDFKEELFPSELDRITPHLEKLIERMPSFGEAGIKVVNNGPMCWTPDGLPMLGPIPDHEGLWLAAGFNVGIGTGGGSAEFLSAWMTTGKPPFELDIVHADRFGNDMSTETALDSIKKVYAVGYELPDSI